MRALAVMRLSDGKAKDKLAPLLGAAPIEAITLVRARPVPLASERLRQVTRSTARGDGALARWRDAFFCLRHALAEAYRERPDVVVGYYLLPYGLIAWLVSRLSGARSIISLTGTDFNRDLHRPWLAPVLRMVLRRSHGVLVFGEDARETIVGLGVAEERTCVLPNTVDTSIFHPRDGRPDTDLIYVGYLRAAKRVERVLHTLHRLRELRPGASLAVVGDGPERRRLEELARELGIADAVRFAGTSTDVAGELARARLFISLTEMEGLPAALLEALCCGLPAIVADVGAVGSVLESGRNGYCVPASTDPGEVARLAAGALEDPTRYEALRREALRAAETHGYAQGAFIWERVFRGAG